MRRKKKYRRYTFQKSAIILGIIICFVFLGTLIAMIVVLSLKIIDQSLVGVFELIKEISLIGFSVFGSSLISSLFIERRNKNKEYASMIANDVISDETFLANLSEENEKKIKEKILGESYTRGEMVDSFIDHIKDEDFYFSKCTLDINCKIINGKIHKTIIRKMEILSLEKTCTKKEFKLIGVAGEEDYKNNKDLLKIKYIKINGKELSEKDYRKICEDVEANQYGFLHNKYAYKCRCVLCDELTLNCKKPVIIELEYETIVSSLDTKYVSRITAPCKHFSIEFVMENTNENKYNVSGTAFGFMDNGIKQPNNQPNTFKAIFDHWTYKDDGVVIFIKEEKE